MPNSTELSRMRMPAHGRWRVSGLESHDQLTSESEHPTGKIDDSVEIHSFVVGDHDATK